MEKKEEDFDYLAEAAKASFQAKINSLLELEVYLNGKRKEGKEGIFLANAEVSVIRDWINEIAGGLMGDYVSLDRTNRYTNKLWKCAIKVAEVRRATTPSIKGIKAA
jgi:hypothetical protein